MVSYEQQNVKQIINAFIFDIKNVYTPIEIINVIYIFYDKLISFNVSDKHGNIMNYCKYLTFSNESYFFMNKDNILYCKGNNVYGSLGICDRNTKFVDKLCKHGFINGKDIMLIDNRSMNGRHSFVYTRSNKLYSFGFNTDAQTGWKSSSNMTIRKAFWKPFLVEYTFDSVLKEIKTGYYHSIFLTENGNIYGCGSNLSGKLSNKYISNHSNRCSIQKIYNKCDVKHIGCGESNSYFLTKNGVLYGFGGNYHSQLGRSTIDIEWSSQMIVILDDKVHQFDCGFNHVGCLLGNNIVYMFGANYDFQCGTDQLFGVTGHNILLNDNNSIINAVKCGGLHTIIKTNDNNYYGFGTNIGGELLIENTINIDEPTLILKEYIYKLTNSTKNIIDLVPLCHSTLIIQSS